VLRQLGPDIQWVDSYVAADKTFCVYLAKDEDIIKKHAEINGFPATKITEIRKMIVNVVKWEDLKDLCDVAHSYGGFPASGALEQIAERVSQSLQRVFRRVAQPAVEVAVLRALRLLPSNVDLSRPRLIISLSESLHYQS
jgi:hypothetical protein